MNDPKGILDEVKKAVVGKDGVLVMALLAILAGGHILLEDIPGVGKTTMAVSLSKALGLDYNRVQFTPDVLPSDIVGFSVYNKATGAMEYKDGAILCNLFLADELNRATSRTQSALLEAMEERTVTVDGVSHPVPDPFVVIATQNPVGASGTQLLPDSQMDRFMVRLSLGYPKPSDEKEMLTRKQQGNPLDTVRCMADKGGLASMRQECERTYVSDKILEYVIRLNNATRNDPAILQGASPRASLAVTSMAKAAAWVQGRDYVLPADVKLIYPATICHRIILTPDAEAAGRKAEALIDDILKAVPAPVAK